MMDLTNFNKVKVTLKNEDKLRSLLDAEVWPSIERGHTYAFTPKTNRPYHNNCLKLLDLLGWFFPYDENKELDLSKVIIAENFSRSTQPFNNSDIRMIFEEYDYICYIRFIPNSALNQPKPEKFITENITQEQILNLLAGVWLKKTGNVEFKRHSAQLPFHRSELRPSTLSFNNGQYEFIEWWHKNTEYGVIDRLKRTQSEHIIVAEKLGIDIMNGSTDDLNLLRLTMGF